MKRLFRITVKAYKVFYVEAESQDAAISHPAIEDEESPNWTGEFDWEHDETDAKEVGHEEAESLLNLHPELIAKDEE